MAATAVVRSSGATAEGAPGTEAEAAAAGRDAADATVTAAIGIADARTAEEAAVVVPVVVVAIAPRSIPRSARRRPASSRS